MPLSTSVPEQRGPVRRVGVLGGGTAGYFAALALKKRFPSLEVTVLESSAIPIVGVGEATTTLMPPFLHAQLGLDVATLFREVRPTFKLGIRFDWGAPGDHFFNYPFGASNPQESQVFSGDLHGQSFVSLLMNAGRMPLVRDESGTVVSLLPRLKFGYHLDNEPFVRFLASEALRRGIAHADVTIETVRTSVDGERIEALRTSDGREFSFDLYIDASGFRSRLLESALGSPFESYRSSLWCDTALVASVPLHAGIAPYTQAETMDAGWCWNIPVEREAHRGYVFSSAHISPAAAEAEMRAKNPGMQDPWTVRFRSGRHTHFWKGNVVAVGNAYGFVEPLESTALHMVIVELGYLLGCLEAAGDGPVDVDFANENVGRHWDFLRWFLALHYRFNNRLDTAFWRECRAQVDVSGFDDLLERYRTSAEWQKESNRRYHVGDPSFGYSGVATMLLGQRVEGRMPAPRITRQRWDQRVERQRALVERALPQAEALAELHARPELLEAFAIAPDSWCQGRAEAISVSPRRPGEVVSPRQEVERAVGPWEELLRGV